MALIDLLDTRLNTFFYHILAFLVSGAIVGIASIQQRRQTRNPDYRLLLQALGGLLALRALLLFGAPRNSTILAPLAGGMEVASLNLLGWAFVITHLEHQAKSAYLIVGLGATALCVILLLPGWHNALIKNPDQAYSGFWQSILWSTAGMLLALTPALVSRLGQHWKKHRLSMFGFAILSLGYTILCSGSLFLVAGRSSTMAYILVRLGHLINLLSYSILVVALRRTPLDNGQIHPPKSSDAKEEAPAKTQSLVSLLNAVRSIGESLDLDTILRRGVQNTVAAVNADRCAIFLLNPGRTGSIRLVTHPTPFQHPAHEPPTQSFAIADHPILHYTLERRRQLVFKGKNGDPRLQELYGLLGSDEIGPTIVQPLVHQRHILGVLVLGNDRSGRSFAPNEELLCQSIGAQIACAVDNARIYSDVETQLRELADSLQSQENERVHLEAVLGSIDEGVIVGDPEGRVVLFNSAAEHILGVPGQHILGRSIKHIANHIPSLSKDIWTEITQATSATDTTFQLADSLIHVSATPILRPPGDRSGVRVILRDITRETEAERSRSEFPTAVSRELLTPLTAIRGYAEALSDGMVGPVSQAQSQLLGIIRDNVLRMVSLTENLTAVSQIEKGLLKLKYGEIDLHLLIKDVVSAFQNQIKAHQLKTSLEIDDDLHTIEADPARLRQILDNLVSNAIKFTYPGGHIIIGTKPVYDSDDEDEDGPPRHCLMWISDTGIGIEPEEQPRIWKRFYRPNNSMTAETSGLGIGLSIVKSLVEAHNGRVWVDSTLGVGSTFKVLLPIRYNQPIGYL